MMNRHRWTLVALAAAWTMAMLLGALLAWETIGLCGALNPALLKACGDAAREAQWGILASPVGWAVLIAGGWLAIASVDALVHGLVRHRAADR
jgi:hypothetical protein